MEPRKRKKARTMSVYRMLIKSSLPSRALFPNYKVNRAEAIALGQRSSARTRGPRLIQ